MHRTRAARDPLRHRGLAELRLGRHDMTPFWITYAHQIHPTWFNTELFAEMQRVADESNEASRASYARLKAEVEVARNGRND